jgi:hypothetical protein
LVGVCLALVYSARAWADAAEEFPCTAYVSSPRPARVYSGPGRDYYPTDQLQAGTEVEVYKRLNKDWVAIRPPEGSFSLVPVSVLNVSGKDDLGTVTQEVKTIVGSRLGAGRYDVEYVTLSPGEVVQILGSTELPLEEGQDLMCYEIAPPAGEFRWMRAQDLVPDDPARVRDTDQTDEARIVHSRRAHHRPHRLLETSRSQWSLSSLAAELRRPTRTADPEESTALVRPAQFLSSDSPDEAPRSSGPAPEQLPLLVAPDPLAAQAGSDLSAPSLRPPPSAPPGASSPANRVPPSVAEPPPSGDSLGLMPPPDPRQTERHRETSGWPGSGVEASVAAPLALPEIRPFSRREQPLQLGPIGKLRLGQELIDIELQLTKQVCQSPTTWHLSDLRARAQAVIDASHDPQQRATAQKIIAKIAQFEDVRRRQRSILASNFDRNAPDTRVVSRANGDDAYDGSGFLMPVVTQDPNIPKYVLTDEQGNILQFVSPKPGINLKRFEQQRVGILGDKSFLPTYNQPHLMAERIITLDKTR